MVILLTIMIVQQSKEASVKARKIDCTSVSCANAAKQLRSDETAGEMINDFKINLSSSKAVQAKRDCTSPMCWFRPGKRESYDHPTNMDREVKKFDKSCNSPMCWFRSRRRNIKLTDMATRKAAWRNLLQTVRELKENKARQASNNNKGCDSPMCWFRPGREVQKINHEKMLNYIREVRELKEALKREMEKKAWNEKQWLIKLCTVYYYFKCCCYNDL